MTIDLRHQNYMPATISGAVGVLWTCVIVNADSGLWQLYGFFVKK